VAEDLTSVVFLEAWRRRAEVELERDLALPWLLGVAMNVLRNRRRSGGIAPHNSACRATVGGASRMTSTSASTTNGGCERS
jgi:DNA-directed RNA polymerase specialized sigma24 family protein